MGTSTSLTRAKVPDLLGALGLQQEMRGSGRGLGALRGSVHDNGRGQKHVRHPESHGNDEVRSTRGGSGMGRVLRPEWYPAHDALNELWLL
jgi:hypothetical protein